MYNFIIEYKELRTIIHLSYFVKVSIKELKYIYFLKYYLFPDSVQKMLYQLNSIYDSTLFFPGDTLWGKKAFCYCGRWVNWYLMLIWKYIFQAVCPWYRYSIVFLRNISVLGSIFLLSFLLFILFLF